MRKKLIIAALALLWATNVASASTRARWIGGRLEYWDETTTEVVQVTAPFQHVEEFAYVATGLPAYNVSGANSLLYRTRNTGTAGSIEVSLTATAPGLLKVDLGDKTEEMQAHIYWADRKMLDPNKMLGYNVRAAANHASNSTDTAEINIGLAGDYASGMYGSANFVGFRAALDSDAPTWQAVIRDSTETQLLATGVSVTKGAAHDFRVEIYDLSDIAFIIDGEYVQYGASTTLTDETLQPQVHAYKQTGTAEVVLEVDFIKIWADR